MSISSYNLISPRREYLKLHRASTFRAWCETRVLLAVAIGSPFRLDAGPPGFQWHLPNPLRDHRGEIRGGVLRRRRCLQNWRVRCEIERFQIGAQSSFKAIEEWLERNGGLPFA